MACVTLKRLKSIRKHSLYGVTVPQHLCLVEWKQMPVQVSSLGCERPGPAPSWMEVERGYHSPQYQALSEVSFLSSLEDNLECWVFEFWSQLVFALLCNLGNYFSVSGFFFTLSTCVHNASPLVSNTGVAAGSWLR